MTLDPFAQEGVTQANVAKQELAVDCRDEVLRRPENPHDSAEQQNISKMICGWHYTIWCNKNE